MYVFTHAHIHTHVIIVFAPELDSGKYTQLNDIIHFPG